MENAREAYDPMVTISVTPDKLSTTLSWVTVQWSGISGPKDNDWIGVYSQTPYDLKSSPSKGKYCNESKDFMHTGSGSLEFRLVNMRAAYTFVLFRNGLSSPVAVATSNQVSFANYNEPLQVHLALTSIPSEMQVSWNTLDAQSPTVHWGTTSGQYKFSASADSSTYTANDLCGAPATTTGWMPPGTLHNALLTGLTPSTRYYYIVGDAAYGFSEEFSFISSPEVAASAQFKFIAYGDMGKGEVDGSMEHWQEIPSLNTTSYVQKEVQENNHTLVVHIGDIAYAVGYAAQWDEFMAQIQPVAANVPYMTCIGNHERDFPSSGSFYTGTDSGGECGVPYEHRFRMPRPSNDQPWYSFNYGSIHFILMSTEHDFYASSAQYAFITRDLAAVNRSQTPWVIFSGHRPMYISSTNRDPKGGDQTVATELREHLEAVLYRYKVDVALWGHHHSYQRTCAVYREKCVEANEDGSNNAPVHIVIGMAGMGLSTNIEAKQPEWFKFIDDREYGYTRWSVSEHELTIEFLSDVDGQLRDTYTLKK
eukprot:TRINITY_DN3448_c0_g1_i1.p1 TRINITY_DN3448_c0_g1~~TRINITY_DN3448_c0_g1_i1.p1  ORF type:complete len:576 (+),score=64.75 TRINITY_DN3448_c0_g1_i1:121-1728(+)